MEGPRPGPQDGDGTAVSALVGLPIDVLSASAQSAATLSPFSGCEQPGVSTSATSVAAGCAPSVYHLAAASGTSTRSPETLDKRAYHVMLQEHKAGGKRASGGGTKPEPPAGKRAGAKKSRS